MITADQLKTVSECRALRARIRNEWDTPSRWKIIRSYYAKRKTDIEQSRVDPYELGLQEFMTPIEAMVWTDIRFYGLPLYLQYPVGRRFVDFGDPLMSLAIEVDGARWHDPKKDAQKDAELKAHGWRVIRIKGYDSFTSYGTEQIKDVCRLYGKAMEETGETD